MNHIQYNIFDIIYSVIIAVSLYIMTLLVYIIALFVPINYLQYCRYYFVCLTWIPLYILQVRRKVMGYQYIKQMQNTSFIIASSHGSYIDALIHTLDFTYIKYIAASFLKNFSFIRDYIFVNRDDSDMKALLKAVNFLKKGIQLCIFPSGTRTAPTKRIQYKSGIAHMAYLAKVPIVPCVLNTEYVGNMLQCGGDQHTWQTSIMMFKFGRRNIIYTKYLKPIYYRPFMSRIHYNTLCKYHPMSVNDMHTIFDYIIKYNANKNTDINEHNITADVLNDQGLLHSLYNMISNNEISKHLIQYNNLVEYINKYQDKLNQYIDFYNQYCIIKPTLQNQDHYTSALQNVSDDHAKNGMLYMIQFGVFIENLKEAITQSTQKLSKEHAQLFTDELQILIESDPVFMNNID